MAKRPIQPYGATTRRKSSVRTVGFSRPHKAAIGHWLRLIVAASGGDLEMLDSERGRQGIWGREGSKDDEHAEGDGAGLHSRPDRVCNIPRGGQRVLQ